VEESCELIRKRLARRQNFSSHQAFSHCDSQQNGYLSAEDFRRVLLENQVYVTDAELKALVARYDTNADGRVSYSEFVQELAPKSQSKLF
jgi:Ca2+-binding EF-hand superfamily protein